MTYETYKTVLQALANGHPCNTSNDFSIVVENWNWNQKDDYRLWIFPSEFYPFFTDCHLRCLTAIAEVYNIHLCVDSKKGVVTAHFS